jgi:hypothetical protein
MRGVRVSRADRAEYGRASSGPPPISRAIVEVDVHDALDEDRPPHNRISSSRADSGAFGSPYQSRRPPYIE